MTAATNRDEAEALYTSLRNAQKYKESEQVLIEWERFSLEEVTAAITPEEISRAHDRCSFHAKHAKELACIKWRDVEQPIIDAMQTLEDARVLWRMAPNDSEARRRAEKLWDKLSKVEVDTISDLESARKAMENTRIHYHSFQLWVRAKKRWDEFAMVEAKAATNVEEAKVAYGRAREKSAARKYLVEKFFGPPT